MLRSLFMIIRSTTRLRYSLHVTLSVVLEICDGAVRFEVGSGRFNLNEDLRFPIRVRVRVRV